MWLSSNGKLKEAMEVFSEHLDKDLVPDVFTYSSLISAFCKQGDLKKAFELHEDMCQKGINPNIVSYNALIDGLCKLGDIERARELFDGIPRARLARSCVTYATIIDGYCKSGNLAEAFQLFDRMTMEGVPPDGFVYCSLIDGCCKNGNMEKALSLFLEMVDKGIASTSAFNALIMAFAGTMKAEQLFLEMEKRNLMPNVLTYTMLLHGYNSLGNRSKMYALFDDDCKRAGRTDKAAKALESMVRFKWVPDSILLCDLLNEDSTNSVNADDFSKQTFDVACQIKEQGEKKEEKRIKQRLRDCEVDLILSFASNADGDRGSD
ncbi:hypothetical protein GH714_025462 [Hevea brasiliensis]|uniref:Pentacotripeptide-repeat region of PRORP domain-containing protein n=1 Tax=Hevea brasiliensis TaxID=3981 RepID=A0A6A6MD53_HEVBR|nr:hypothetical protein GH714_025462 [Hevea brasiliensis]